MTDHELDLRLPNDLAELDALSSRIEAFMEAAGIATTPAYRLQLAVDEFFNNAVDYGYPDGRAGEIGIEVRRVGDKLHLVFSDDGDPFDPFAAPAPDLDGALAERRVGGLGVHLVRTLCDSFAYAREKDRNVKRLTFALAD
ncbi:ATP-binding protein [Ancylobacter vacuolatus]|uniref:Anti-sigma regulatory factor (Ser/Thr protein kinase) n=1 Tax=Ancylobacter vacuolatus TaxID=223389 RepID=A0ABU0DB82_9HYPH|nr:ATP-binding protein [Ancylobacter vacuolatus]MDQ0345682.1 anti-sigma regulatory factor (Ser/Thr protein kinase) [Ancylobacter vacuolatus]